MGSLQKKLEEYYNKEYLPMHMPGHKRNVELLGEKLPYKIDITEIEGFDDLHNPEGIIKNIEEKAKKLYKSEKSFILVNGSTCGILSGIRACVNTGDKVLVARNCHKSVYNALEINGLNPIYIVPEIERDGIDRNISISDVKKKLEENKDIKLIIITSPTYEGIISDIKQIVDIAHKYNVPVLVDEAHGAHLNFIDELKSKEALNVGADIVVQSLHKTLPALTGTALLHIQGNLVKEENVKRQLAIFETSSPSYILMASIEECLDIIKNKGKELFNIYNKNLKNFYKKTDKLEKLSILGNEIKNDEYLKKYYDFGKIVIKTDKTNITGKELSDILRKDYKIELEMASSSYVIAMTSICDSYNNFERLLNALLEIDEKLELKKDIRDNSCKIQLPKKKVSILKALENKNYKLEEYKNVEGKISREYIWIYPPGVPLITPGEEINKDVIEKIQEFEKSKISVRTTFGKFPKIEVIDI